MNATGDGVGGGEGALELEVRGQLPVAAVKKFPHLSGCTALALPSGAAPGAAQLVRCQLAVSAEEGDGTPVAATGVLKGYKV